MWHRVGLAAEPVGRYRQPLAMHLLAGVSHVRLGSADERPCVGSALHCDACPYPHSRHQPHSRGACSQAPVAPQTARLQRLFFCFVRTRPQSFHHEARPGRRAVHTGGSMHGRHRRGTHGAPHPPAHQQGSPGRRRMLIRASIPGGVAPHPTTAVSPHKYIASMRQGRRWKVKRHSSTTCC
jgi:hypothetical protein